MPASLRRLRRFPQRMPRSGKGFTYIGLLTFIAILGIGLAATGTVFHQQAVREKEKELLFVGDQMRRAITQYYERSPGGGRFPQTLEDLLRDQRYVNVERHLRRIYRDPMTGSTDWGLVRAPDGGIQGVYSKSTAKPVKTAGFPPGYDEFADRKSYADWQFVSTAMIMEHIEPGIPRPE